MGKKRVLFVSQEITPYMPENHMSLIGRNLPQGIMEQGKDIRIFTPKYGCINERRNQLHEVIRLSGMNMILDNLDYPLIIKVASLQPVRMQVYFIDNEDYFPKKTYMHDYDGSFFEFHDERTIFFCRGVLETVRKLGWPPDVVHCHGWMSALVPMYLKKAFADDPIFMHTKVIYSVYNQSIDGVLSGEMAEKSLVQGVSENDVETLQNPTINNLHKLAISYSDGVIVSDEIDSEIKSFIQQADKPSIISFNQETYKKEYNDLYDQILEESSVLS